MEKFNEIKNKFEPDFDAIQKKNTEEPEYENIGAFPKKTVNPELLKNRTSFTTKKALKPPRSTPRKMHISSSSNEYENIEFEAQKSIKVTNALTQHTRKKKIKTPKTKPLAILPTINEDFAKLSLALPEPEYANIVPRNLATQYFLPDNISPQSNLSEEVLYPSQDLNQADYEYMINNSLYVDFFQRTGQLPTDFSSEVKSSSTSTLQKENEAFFIKTNLSNKNLTTYLMSSPFISKKIKKLSEKPISALHPVKVDEPIFANITGYKPDGTIEWETWQPDEKTPIQSNSQSKPKLSKLLPKNLNFWSKPSKKNLETFEETNVLEVKKPFPSL